MGDTGKKHWANGDVVAGRYRLGELLGVGGMGLVFEARHMELDQPVAIKFVRELGLDYRDRSRFRREAQVLFGLRSSHFARVLDYGFHEETPFIAMELLHGMTLQQLLNRQGCIPHATAVEYLLQAAEALAEAHSKGIVHRDLKPSNLFLTQDIDGSDLIKIIDFGVAKVRWRAGREGSVVTQLDVGLGTPPYFAPEQARNASSADARSDVWALAMTLTALIGGKPAFPRDLSDYVASLGKGPVFEPESAFPVELTSSLKRALSVDPWNRTPNVAAFARDIARLPAQQSLVSRIERILASGTDVNHETISEVIAFDQAPERFGGDEKENQVGLQEELTPLEPAIEPEKTVAPIPRSTRALNLASSRLRAIAFVMGLGGLSFLAILRLVLTDLPPPPPRAYGALHSVIGIKIERSAMEPGASKPEGPTGETISDAGLDRTMPESVATPKRTSSPKVTRTGQEPQGRLSPSGIPATTDALRTSH